jgi:DNA-binding transcriptional regulator YiaG
MGKVETVLKAEIARLSRRETRRLMTKHVEELRRLRRRVAELSQEVRALKAARAEEQVKTKIRTAAETVAGAEVTTVRMSPRLIRSLRKRLGISQAELAKLVGVSTVAVGQWESGRSRPRSESKARIAALRSVGRREVRRLLGGAEMMKATGKEDYPTIKALVLDFVHRCRGHVDYEALTKEVKTHFPASRWKKTHWTWYKHQILHGRFKGLFTKKERAAVSQA